MSGLYRLLSHYLQKRPLVTNLALSSSVAFGGDLVCQTIYEPLTLCRPPLTLARLPDESAHSPFLIKVTSPSLWCRAWWRRRWHGAAKYASNSEVTVLVDLRRSLIFCSFTFLFGVPFFLWVYRRLDAIISPVGITKKGAIVKGAMSYVAAQVTNPLFLTYVTTMDHFFIYRDGRDGRRRVAMPAPSSTSNLWTSQPAKGETSVPPLTANPAVLPPSPDEKICHQEFSALSHATTYKMGHTYRFVDDRRFNLHEFVRCAGTDAFGRLQTDFPDIMKYGFVFWSANWLPMFYYIPSHFRLAYSSALQVVWSGVMSYLLHRKDSPLDHQDEVQNLQVLRS